MDDEATGRCQEPESEPELDLEEEEGRWVPEIPFTFGGKESVLTAVEPPSRIPTGLSPSTHGIIVLILVHWCWYQQRRGGLGGRNMFPGIVWGGGGVKGEGG